MPSLLPMGRPDAVVSRRPSQPAIGMEAIRPWSQEAYQPLRPIAPAGRSVLPNLQPRQTPAQTISNFADTMSPPSRPVFSRSPSAQPLPKANLLTPPSTSDSSNGLRHRSDSLKALEKWPFIHEAAVKRPGMYASPYANNGGYNDSALAADVTVTLSTTPQMRSRSTSLMQDFLSKASPHQRELVRGHARTISTDKAAAKSREAERRMSESIQRQARLSGGNMSPIDMSEGLLGPDFGRPGSSSVISDRGSPFPDFNNIGASSHAHPQSLRQPSNTASLGAVDPSVFTEKRTQDSSMMNGLTQFLNIESTSVESAIRDALPNKSLKQHTPNVYYSTADQFSAQLQQAASLYPMGTRPSSYNSTLRDLHHAAAGADWNLKRDKQAGSQLQEQAQGSSTAAGLGNSSFCPSHGHRVSQGAPSISLITPSDIKRSIGSTLPDSARYLSPPPAPILNGVDNDIAVDDSLIDYDRGQGEQLASPLKEGFEGGNSMLPAMTPETFINMG